MTEIFDYPLGASKKGNFTFNSMYTRQGSVVDPGFLVSEPFTLWKTPGVQVDNSGTRNSAKIRKYLKIFVICMQFTLTNGAPAKTPTRALHPGLRNSGSATGIIKIGPTRFLLLKLLILFTK